MNSPFMIEGEIDLAREASFRDELVAHATVTPGDIAVDCSGLTFIGSSGMRALVEVQNALAGRQMVLMDVRPQCLRTFEVCGLDQVFTMKNAGMTDVA